MKYQDPGVTLMLGGAVADTREQGCGCTGGGLKGLWPFEPQVWEVCPSLGATVRKGTVQGAATNPRAFLEGSLEAQREQRPRSSPWAE